MLLGIFSDTHDNLPLIEKAVRFFNQQAVDFVLHAGDFVAPFSVNKIKKLKCDWKGIFGNNDGEQKGLSVISEGRIQSGPLRVKLEGKEITLVHDIMQIEPDNEPAKIIICGHTHKPQIINQGSKLVINPGECCGWLWGKASVALLELNTLKAKLYDIE
ncbi:MAG: metallophosphoesterase [Candidatus Omnitrophota bacterium]|nr:metallophosphoesterase [Candidatus Omnitrophota bacterium]